MAQPRGDSYQSGWTASGQPKLTPRVSRLSIEKENSVMQVSWTGIFVFVASCVALWFALARPVWMPAAEAIVTVLIVLGIAGAF